MTDTAGPASTDPRYVWLGLTVRADKIPAALKSIDQWVLWKAEPRKAPRTGMDKVPYQASGNKASSSDAATWTDFATAIATLEEDESTYDGVGFAAQQSNGIVLLDWDHVRNAETGEIDEGTLAAIRYLETYAEISPSGTGIRVLGYGALAGAITSATLQGWVSGHYVTITGHHVDGTPADLQAIDPVRLAQVRAHFAPEKPAEAARVDGLLLDTRRTLELRHALGHIPSDDYATWIKIGMALQSTNAANAFGLWHEWSTGSAKYPGIGECRKKWASFSDRPGGIEIETVFGVAKQHGWVNPATRAAQAFEREVGLSIEEANRRQPEPEIADIQPVQLAPWPVPGLDEVCVWLESHAYVSYPVATAQAALILAASAASRKYITPQGDPLALYLGIVGRSVGELRYAHQGVHQALAAAGLRRMIRATRFTSPQSIYRTLFKTPAALYLEPEWGALLAFSRRQPSGLQEQALSVLAGLYDGRAIQLDSPEDAGLKAGQTGDDQPVIEAPSLSMLALIGQDQLAGLMKSSELGRGALNQMLIAIADPDIAIAREPRIEDAPAWLPGHLRALREVPEAGGAQLEPATIFDGCATLPPQHLRTVAFSAPLATYYDLLDDVSDDPRVRPLLLSARGTVRRIAGVLAAWRDPQAPVADAGIIAWAAGYVQQRLAELVEQFAILHGEDGKVSVYDQVYGVILRSKTDGIQAGQLSAACKGFRNLSGKLRGELVQQLLEDEVVVEITKKQDGRGRPSKRLVSSKYLKK